MIWEDAFMWPYNDTNGKTTELQWMEIYDPNRNPPEIYDPNRNPPFVEAVHDNGWEAWEWKETYVIPFSNPEIVLYVEGPRPWRYAQF